MTLELLHVTYEGRQYDIPALWIAGFCQRLPGRPERSILDAVRHWHEQVLLAEAAARLGLLGPAARSNAPTTDDQSPTLPEVPAAGDRGLQGRSGGRED